MWTVLSCGSGLALWEKLGDFSLKDCLCFLSLAAMACLSVWYQNWSGASDTGFVLEMYDRLFFINCISLGLKKYMCHTCLSECDMLKTGTS